MQKVLGASTKRVSSVKSMKRREFRTDEEELTVRARGKRRTALPK
ncbi:MAG: hypothetical protein ACLTEE_01835 [Anaerobutyricum hallii]